jgi:hypothetical protein
MEATEVLERACDWFGGEDRWRRIRVFRLHSDGLTGLLPLLKGNHRTFSFPRVIEVSPHERTTRFLEFPAAGCHGIYENGSVRIERTATGEVVESSRDHRATFRGFAKNRLWRPIDALFFFGYALVHYHSLPFSLKQARPIGVCEHTLGGARVRALHVELPPGLQTHSRRETFFFDESGAIVRHDYVADVVGAWARGAHLWQNVTRIDGFPVAMERRVLPKLGSLAIPGITVLHAGFRHAEVEFES